MQYFVLLPPANTIIFKRTTVYTKDHNFYYPVKVILCDWNYIAALEKIHWRNYIDDSVPEPAIQNMFICLLGLKKQNKTDTPWIKVLYSYNSSLSHHNMSKRVYPANVQVSITVKLLNLKAESENFKLWWVLT